MSQLANIRIPSRCCNVKQGVKTKQLHTINCLVSPRSTFVSTTSPVSPTTCTTSITPITPQLLPPSLLSPPSSPLPLPLATTSITPTTTPTMCNQVVVLSPLDGFLGVALCNQVVVLSPMSEDGWFPVGCLV